MLLSLPMLGDVVILTLFFFAIFGILCVELFKGKLGYRCGAPDFSAASSVYTVDGNILLQVGEMSEFYSAQEFYTAPTIKETAGGGSLFSPLSSAFCCRM